MWAALALVPALVVAGCGAGDHPAPRLGTQASSVCLSSTAAVVARVTHVSAPVKSVAAIGNNAAPECRLVAGRVRVVVNVDSSPQPYVRLEREIVEDGQRFGTVRSFAAPVAVDGLGLGAAWLPDQDTLIAADRRRLISVSVSWKGPRRPRRALARSLAQLYLTH